MSFLMMLQYLFSNPRALIALEFNFNFSFWERLVINVNKDIERVLICFIGVFNFFNAISIFVVQSIFKFVNIFFRVRAFAGRFYDWSLGYFIDFNREDNRKMIWQVSFYYTDLKSLWSVTLLVIIWPMAFNECLITRVGLFFKGIIL